MNSEAVSENDVTENTTENVMENTSDINGDTKQEANENKEKPQIRQKIIQLPKQV